ncbi:hypothetical protein [Microcoleus sp. OTE_8_concoct_300]|uniref:hypothetical protein n=1 Tax=Microcoleus sp. OTE_8_concoct_300 TaxID=2964710 RepID=UPI00403F4E3C
MPEPAPQNAREDDADGARPEGQAPDGNETHTPPADWTARTTATDRAANAPRPEPNDATEKTRAEGKKPRNAASTPAAQPTNTGTPAGTSVATAAQTGGAYEREPEKPTAGAEETRERTRSGRQAIVKPQ